MDDVSIQLTRECFELNRFHVLTHWKQGRSQFGDHGAQLLVENTNFVPGNPPGLIIFPTDLAYVERAIVEVRAWHAHRLYPSVIEANPVLVHFAQKPALTSMNELFGNRPFSKILVVSEFPTSPEHRTRSIQLLSEAGIDHVLELPSILFDLSNKIDINGVYPASQTLQTLRLLKRYRLLRHQQMEFLFSMESPESADPAQVETTEDAEE